MPRRRRIIHRNALIRRKNQIILTWLLGLSVATLWALSVSAVQASEPHFAELDAIAPGGLPGTAVAERFVGTASVIDGDTIEIAGRRIELYGIDAPELEQTCKVIIFSWGCGEDAQKMLSALVAEREVSCVAIARAGDATPLAAPARKAGDRTATR